MDAVLAAVYKKTNHKIQWIANELACKWNLTPDSGYEKVGLTDTDIQILLRTLWERADHIPMQRKQRVNFHFALLVLHLSGCRPGMVGDIKWKHVQLALVRDPCNPKRARLVASLTLIRNKRKRDAVLTRPEDDT